MENFMKHFVQEPVLVSLMLCWVVALLTSWIWIPVGLHFHRKSLQEKINNIEQG